MKEIKIERQPDEQRLKELGIETWPVWSKEVSEFLWEYDADEICYILEGEVTVTPENSAPVVIKAGDLVTFPKGMKCVWKITKNIRKHYCFPD